MRIVSLLPSATEIVCALGLDNQIVGVTHECDFPPSVRDLPKVTRTLIPPDAASAEIDALVRERLRTQRPLYTLDGEMLERLRPDLIVTQALCDVCAVAEAEVREAACRLPGQPRVLNLEPLSLTDVFDTLLLVGRAAGLADEARRVVADLRARVEAVTHRTAALSIGQRPRVAFLEWIDPPFCGGHWNPALVEMAGGVNLLGTAGEPSCSVNWAEIAAAQPDALFIACCGYTTERAIADIPVLRNQSGWDELPCVRNGRVSVADGSAYFNRPGPRLVDSLEILAHALHPDSSSSAARPCRREAGRDQAICRVRSASLRPDNKRVFQAILHWRAVLGLGAVVVTVLILFLLGFVLPTLWRAIQILASPTDEASERTNPSEAYPATVRSRNQIREADTQAGGPRLMIQTGQCGQTRVMELTGDLDLYTSETFTESLQAEIACRTALPLVIDMTHVPYTDSSGWSTLVKTHQALSAGGRAISVILARGTQPEQTYAVMGLETIVPRTEPPAQAA